MGNGQKLKKMLKFHFLRPTKPQKIFLFEKNSSRASRYHIGEDPDRFSAIIYIAISKKVVPKKSNFTDFQNCKNCSKFAFSS